MKCQKCGNGAQNCTCYSALKKIIAELSEKKELAETMLELVVEENDVLKLQIKRCKKDWRSWYEFRDEDSKEI